MGIPGSESCEGPAALERSPLPGASGVCSWEIAGPASPDERWARGGEIKGRLSREPGRGLSTVPSCLGVAGGAEDPEREKKLLVDVENTARIPRQSIVRATGNHPPD